MKISANENKLKIYEVLPELEIGGVERFVVDISNALADLGHDVTVVSNGGQMERQLTDKVKILHLPVHSKNPFKIIFIAKKMAKIIARNGGCDLLHAHSRVPAWICQIVAKKLRVPFVVTAHGIFNTKTYWIYAPYRNANATVCVSQAVQDAMQDRIGQNSLVVINGLKSPTKHWQKNKSSPKTRFLFIGRLTNVKGLQDIISAMAELPNDLKDTYSLTVCGEGPQKEEWKDKVKELGLEQNINFVGYIDNPKDYMSSHSCLLVPSHVEGMPLAMCEGVLFGIPIIASNITPIAELAVDASNLVPVGNIAAWTNALEKFIKTENTGTQIAIDKIPTFEEMLSNYLTIYKNLVLEN